MRRTKVVCTLGPSSNDPAVIRELIQAGMDVARLNFSHGTHESHAANFEAVRAMAREAGRNVAIMADLQGPKIRVGSLKDGKPVVLTPGGRLCLTTRNIVGDEHCVSTTYMDLPRDVKPGDRILLSDGFLELRVESVEGPDVQCLVVRGGKLGEHKGINLPGVAVSTPSLTEKDLSDLDFAMRLGVDYVALSFVRKPQDIVQLREKIGSRDERGRKAGPHIVAKIERPEAINCFEDILKVTDAVMVARGDLGIEAELDEVPQIQKALIRKCNEYGVPVITATQMLESMVEQAQPTRAEVSDVANAIYDGTDAVMLSAETAAGAWPVEATTIMADIARKADQAIAERDGRRPRTEVAPKPTAMFFADAIGQAADQTTKELEVVRIICFTQSGFSARAISRYRTPIPITALTPLEATMRRCALYWGIEAIQVTEIEGIDQMVRAIDPIVDRHGLASSGDTVIVVAGVPFAVASTTNFMYLHRVNIP